MTNKLIIHLIMAGIFLVSPFAIGGAIICPSAKEIKQTAFDAIEKGDHPDVWTLIQNNRYKTPYLWKFSIMVEAKSKSTAFKKAKLALSKLYKTHGPQKVDATWVCDYKAPASLLAIATTTP